MSYVVTMMTEPKSKDYYVVKTFASNTLTNVNAAIDFYKSKYEKFITLANLEIRKSLTLGYKNNKNIDTMFNDAYKKYAANAGAAWAKLQSMDSTTLQSKIAKFNEASKALDKNFKETYSYLQFLNEITGTESIGPKGALLPGTVNLNMLSARLKKFADSRVTGPKSIGGARSNLFGEIFEQGANSSLLEGFAGLLGYMQVGSKNSLLPSGSIGQGKTDGMLFVDMEMDGGLIDITKGRKSYSVTKNHHITLEASELIDLAEKGFLNNVLKTYASDTGIESSMLGITNKSWIGQSGSFGSFAPSARVINYRNTPNGDVTEYFSNEKDFIAYNTYIVSRYLINIIGVYNGIVVAGANAMPTYKWLYNLYSNLQVIRHTLNKTTKNKDQYFVRNSLIVTSPLKPN